MSARGKNACIAAARSSSSGVVTVEVNRACKVMAPRADDGSEASTIAAISPGSATNPAER